MELRSLNSQDAGGRDNAVRFLSAGETVFFSFTFHMLKTIAGENCVHSKSAVNNSRFSADFFGICYTQKLTKNKL